jgi:hypothetical protein
LERRRVDELEAERIEPDVVPERVANDFDTHGRWILVTQPKPGD